MSIVDAILAEARYIQDRPLSQARAEELAAELAALLEASRVLGAQLTFDDQTSDFAQALLDTHTAARSSS